MLWTGALAPFRKGEKKVWGTPAAEARTRRICHNL